MRIKGAMTVLNKRAEFYGKSLDWLIDDMDRCFKETGYIDENQNVIQAYEVYKIDQGYRWSGVNGKRWVMKDIA